MKIGVFVKQVVNVDQVEIDETTGEPVYAGEPMMNVFDAYGVSEALDLKEASGGQVVAIGVGPASVRDVLMRALGTGADEAILVRTDALGELDGLTTAQLLADAVRDGAFDVLIAGQTSEDYENGQVGIQIAELLDIPHVSCVVNVEDAGDALIVQRDWEGSKQRIRAPKPVMLVLLTGRNAPKYHPSLKSMMQAKKKTFQEITPSEISASPLAWSVPSAPEVKPAGTLIQDATAAEAAAALAGWLREQRFTR